MNSIATQTLKQILAATKKAGKNILQAGKKKKPVYAKLRRIFVSFPFCFEQLFGLKTNTDKFIFFVLVFQKLDNTI